MIPLDQRIVHLDNSPQQTTNNSPTRQHTGDTVNLLNNQSVDREQFQNTVTVPPSNFKKKAQGLSTLPSPNSKVRQDSSNRAMKSSTHSKCPETPSKDPHLKSSSSLSWKSLDSSLSHYKSQTTSSFTSTSLLEPSQLSLRSRIPLPKPQTSSSIDLCWKSPSLESTQGVSTSSSSILHHQGTPSLNIIWTSPSLELNQTKPNSLCKCRAQRESSLDGLWLSLLESNQKTLSSSPLKQKLQRNDSSPTSSSLECNRIAQNSLPNSKPLKIPVSNSNNNVLRLPLTHARPKKPPLLSHPNHPSQSSPVYQSKPQTRLRGETSTRVLSSSVGHTKVQSTISPNDKHRVRPLPTVHPKQYVSGLRVSSPSPCIKNKNASVPSSRPQSKGSLEQSVKPDPEKETTWPLIYSHPCIIKGGTVPVDIVNKIVNSISKSTIQKDLSRQILFRRMRGKPNPRPGPRLSTTYSVCLDCASCIKSQCSHLTGKKDPRSATLFVIPTPENSSDGKVDVKIVLILSLPETSSSSGYQFLMKDNQPADNLEKVDDNLEELEKITQIFPASESDFIKGLQTNKKCLAVSSEDKDKRQEPQAVDWLLYVKNRNNIQPQARVPAPSSSSSSSSCSSYSSSSSSSYSAGFHPPPSPCKDPIPAPLAGYVLANVRSHHRLPPGVSWLEFIRGTNSETIKLRQSPSPSPSPKTNHVRTRSTKSMKKEKGGPNTLLRYLQTKFQNEKF